MQLVRNAEILKYSLILGAVTALYNILTNLHHPYSIISATTAAVLIGGYIGAVISKNKQLLVENKARQAEIQENLDQLKQQQEDLNALFYNHSSWIWSIDVENQMMKVSTGIERMLGYDAEEFERDYEFWIKKTYPEDIEIVNKHYQRLLSGAHSEAKWRIYHKDGSIIWIKVMGHPIKNENGKVVRLLGVANDLTKAIEMEKQLHQVSFTDSLTGLPNRLSFNKRMEEWLKAQTDKDNMAILYVNIDRLKVINNMLGFKAGDLVLQIIAKRLQDILQPSDYIARYGGDEFIIALPYTEKANVKTFVHNMMAQLALPFELENQEVDVTVSAGMVLFPEHGTTLNSLMSKASVALHQAKQRGKNRVRFYELEDEALVKRKLYIELALKRAIDADEFELYYQPKIDLSTKEVEGVEALLRWEHPALGFVSPAEFIPIAEESGQMLAIGKWVVQEAVNQAGKWEEEGKPIKVAINVSNLQFEDPDFLNHLRFTLEQHRLSPHLLGVELTESMLQNTQTISPILFELRQMGIHTYVDDFGTGYSSLSMLKTLPIDFIKIDKSFIDEITDHSGYSTLVKTIIDMGESLGFGLVAEGIETQRQADFLLKNGCTLGQGYVFAKPMSVQSFEQFYKSKKLLM
ncbi:EAL domain-containing protein [Domibacillus indicus]|uniref:putative bifunctional diguanylate cyclase/phosphodiesterase n=1 Tax=Domibacillus indicus TaxID=1437523 RepID=UPI00203B5DCC|nr:GGDEF domain-containing phosphodiesterase [Domibacillus indicus]MCM3790040.1 EAL domain-containing protein [Domibacillus indicus]